jgi:hypothetical protein
MAAIFSDVKKIGKLIYICPGTLSLCTFWLCASVFASVCNTLELNARRWPMQAFFRAQTCAICLMTPCTQPILIQSCLRTYSGLVFASLIGLLKYFSSGATCVRHTAIVFPLDAQTHFAAIVLQNGCASAVSRARCVSRM